VNATPRTPSHKQKGLTVTTTQPLGQLVANWPAHAPITLRELHETSLDETLNTLADNGATREQTQQVKALRSQLIDAIHAADRNPITGPDELKHQLANNWIRPVAHSWLTLALNEQRERVAQPRPNGGLSYLTCLTRKVPTQQDLTDRAPLPTGGRYLLIYGGSPDVLTDANTDRLAHLNANLPISDIVFWHLTKNTPPTMYSTRGGTGDRDGTPVPFPNPRHLQTLQASNNRRSER